MGVVYFSIIPTFEPSRYCKCWIVCFYNINIGINDKGVRLQSTDNFEEKKIICTFLEDMVSAKELLEGLNMIIKYVVQNGFCQCIVTEKGCIIKGVRVDLNKGCFYYGSQLLGTN